MTVYTHSKTLIQLEDKPLAAAGGEGTVYNVKPVSAYANACVKIYHLPKRTTSRKKKIAFMISNQPPVLSSPNYIICWPSEMVFDVAGQFIGFLMPLAFHGSEKLYELTTLKIPGRLALHWGKFDRTQQAGIEKRLKVCVNIAIAIHAIHENGKYAVVDYKPQNMLITNEGKVSITDVDSFQIVQNDKVLFHAEVATPEYAPPESASINPSRTLVAESWDRFSLAVSFYEILFGIHPFAATCDGQYHGATTIGEKIQKGLFVHGSKRNYLTVIPPVHDNFKRLPPSLSQLFLKAFEEGHTDNKLRPSAEQWGRAIHEELVRKTGIRANAINVPPKAIRPIGKTIPVPVAQKQLTAKKEDYMVWKICTFVLVAALIVMVSAINTTRNELNTAENTASAAQSEKISMQNRLTQLQSSQSSNQSIYDARINELQTAIDDMSNKYPISLYGVSFNNKDRYNTDINLDMTFFSKNNLQFVYPVIKFNSNCRTAGRYIVYYKMYSPQGTMLTANNSPAGYTWYREIEVPGGFSKNNTVELNGYSFGCPDCSTGKYQVEIWCKDLQVGSTYFYVSE